MILQLNEHTKINHYLCTPDIVIYFLNSKETTLLTSYMALIYICLLQNVEKPIADNQLFSLCNLKENDQSIELQYNESLDKLIQLKLIESIE